MFKRFSLPQLFLLLSVAFFSEHIMAAPHDTDISTFRFEFDNDIFFGSDNLFTDGWSVQWHSPAGTSWEQIKDEHFHVASLGKYLPFGKADNGRLRRHTFAIGQFMQTPSDLESEDFNPNDAPYAGALVLENSWYEYDDRRFRGFELNLGTMGEYSFAGPSQS